MEWQKVRTFHVSIYMGTSRKCGHHWVYSSAGDEYVPRGWDSEPVWMGPTDKARILGLVTDRAKSFRSTFGSSVSIRDAVEARM